MVDLASMREAIKDLGTDADKINPLVHGFCCSIFTCNILKVTMIISLMMHKYITPFLPYIYLKYLVYAWIRKIRKLHCLLIYLALHFILSTAGKI